MNCNNVKSLLDDYLDNDLSLPQRTGIDSHLANCVTCQGELEARKRLLTQLRGLPEPAIRSGFQRQAFQHACRARESNRSAFVLGFSSAIAAGLLIWFGLAWWQTQPPSSVVQLPTVVLQVEQPRDIRLVFHAGQDLKPVDFTLHLPPGVLLQGHPPRQEISWQDRLSRGKNVLNLVLTASGRVDGEVVAVIGYQGHQRRFLVPLKAGTNRSGAGLPLNKQIKFI